jgi:N-acetylneuraminate synthase/sialic acid synthase
MKSFKFGNSTLSQEGPCYVIAEIGHNHQGEISKAIKMIEVAAGCGANAVKFQKRDNKTLFTKEYYNKPYDNENSFGNTYGEHREFLEFSLDDYLKLKKCAEEKGVEFMVTAFDFKSVDFLSDIGLTSFKIASGDLTNTPLLKHIAKTGAPMFISTGAATLEEIRIAYDAVSPYNDKVCIMHCNAIYPADYESLNLKTIEALKAEYKDTIIGYSGHDNGILAPVIAYMLGATVVEKHFTLNRSSKGTDHKFSLSPEGLRKLVRDLARVDIALGNGKKDILDSEKDAKIKMGKSIYTSMPLSAGTVITEDTVCFKTPASGMPPYMVDKIIGKKLKVDLDEESLISMDSLE